MTKNKQVQLHAGGASEVGARRSRGREGKTTMEGNHSEVAEAKKKRKVTSLAGVRIDGRNRGSEICEKRKSVLKVPPKKTMNSPITISSQETVPKRHKPPTREKLSGVVEVDNVLKKKDFPTKLSLQTRATCPVAKPDCVDRLTHEEVEA